ncbi:CAP domain-containing protein [Streptomyces sp. NBC_01340]|uniref:CAP domain-containing protein n=1 Tax=unclassified Streptomyces TaxID=2593676 RepID=UPI00225618B5|nr:MULTISPECIES: CAP domain-containing protein [unclassified Streptomyces]MCX4457730.1 CAP domain-containing protein [Streptomyces sp. NBC_01719]MCX4497087.1 CAP domain-containing protein [Streptomyces sp. NBC_01728]WSI41952.1 CAP domain-containing protein [Streptomyces sp. NBC_01340]
MRTKSNRIRRVCVAACAAPLLVLTGAAGAGAAATVTVPAAVPRALQATPGEILQLVNAERAKADCPALHENAQLTQAAKVFADDADKNNITTHTGSDGSTYQQRIKEAGYNAGPAAENMAWGSSTDAKEVVDGWMKSAGHKGNILNCSFTDTGVAVSGKYKVQVFATPG